MRRKAQPHQLDGLDYCTETEHPALLWEMRVRKTLVTIRAFRAYRRILVVVPFSAMYDWLRELQAENETDYVTLTGTKTKRLKLLDEDHKWTLLNPEGWRSIDSIYLWPWDVVIFDECTKIMNPKAKVTKLYMKKFRAVKRRAILSGTLVSANLLNYFCPFSFLLGGEAFGCRNYYEYRYRYFKPDWFDSNWKPTKQGKRIITDYLRKYASIVSRSDVSEHGQKNLRTWLVDLPPEIRRTYDQLKKEFLLSYRGRKKFTKSVLAKLIWMQQLLGGFADGKLIHTRKLDAIDKLLKGELQEQQVVIYCQFVNEIKALHIRLQNYCKVGSIWGKVSKRTTDRLRDCFRTGRCKVLVCQNQSVTYGADFSNAGTTLYYSNSRDWNVRKQTEDRFISLDKEEVSDVIDLLAADTLDIEIYEGLQSQTNEAELLKSIVRGMG